MDKSLSCWNCFVDTKRRGTCQRSHWSSNCKYSLAIRRKSWPKSWVCEIYNVKEYHWDFWYSQGRYWSNFCRILLSANSVEFRSHRDPLFCRNRGSCRLPDFPGSLELGGSRDDCFLLCTFLPASKEEELGWYKDCKNRLMVPLIRRDRRTLLEVNLSSRPLTWFWKRWSNLERGAMIHRLWGKKPCGSTMAKSWDFGKFAWVWVSRKLWPRNFVICVGPLVFQVVVSSSLSKRCRLILQLVVCPTRSLRQSRLMTQLCLLYILPYCSKSWTIWSGINMLIKSSVGWNCYV